MLQDEYDELNQVQQSQLSVVQEMSECDPASEKKGRPGFYSGTDLPTNVGAQEVVVVPQKGKRAGKKGRVKRPGSGSRKKGDKKEKEAKEYLKQVNQKQKLEDKKNRLQGICSKHQLGLMEKEIPSDFTAQGTAPMPPKPTSLAEALQEIKLLKIELGRIRNNKLRGMAPPSIQPVPSKTKFSGDEDTIRLKDEISELKLKVNQLQKDKLQQKTQFTRMINQKKGGPEKVGSKPPRSTLN